MAKKEPRCPACGDSIKWATTHSGKKIALEIGLDPAGRVILQTERDYATGETRQVAVVLGQHDAEEYAAAGGKVWMAHAAKCAARGPARAVPESIRRRVEQARQRQAV